MPAWLIAAFTAIGVLSASGRQSGVPILPGAIDPFERGGIQLPAFLGGPGEEKKHRHRRRVALTQGDRNSIAFIAATISKAAAGTFAAQLASRSR